MGTEEHSMVSDEPELKTTVTVQLELDKEAETFPTRADVCT